MPSLHSMPKRNGFQLFNIERDVFIVRLLIAIHHFPPHFQSGAELQAMRIAKEMQVRGHQVQVLCIESITQGPAGSMEWVDEVYEGISIRRLYFDLSKTPDPFTWQYANPWVGDHIRELSASFQPDLLHLVSGYLMGGKTIEAAHHAKLPVLVSVTDFWFFCPQITMLRSDGSISDFPLDSARCAQCLAEESRRYRYLGKVFPGVMKAYWQRKHAEISKIEQRRQYLLQQLNSVDKIISPSEFVRSMYIKAGIDAEIIFYSRQGNNFPGLAQPFSKTKANGAGLRVGYIGQIVPHKGVHLLVEAARQLKDEPLQFFVYGDDSKFPAYAKALKRKTSSMNNFFWKKSFILAQITEIYKDLDLLVVPSLWYENSPNVILEAFAHQTPVMTSDFGGMAELVQHNQNGILFEHGNADDIAQYLRKIIKNEISLEALQNGIPRVKELYEEMDELEAFYLSLI